MRILVTGGAGFIGGHLAKSFLEDVDDVTVLDNFEPSALKESNVTRSTSTAK
jgi:Nucleoside-diphosphate-sugar epimerases